MVRSRCYKPIFMGWEDYFKNPARDAEILRENERRVRERKQATEDQERLNKALADQAEIDRASSARERLEGQRTQDKLAKAQVEESKRYWDARAAEDWKEVYATDVIPAVGNNPAYYFLVSQSPQGSLFRVHLVMVLDKEATIIGLENTESVFKTEEFGSEESAKARADQLAETGVRWRVAR